MLTLTFNAVQCFIIQERSATIILLYKIGIPGGIMIENNKILDHQLDFKVQNLTTEQVPKVVDTVNQSFEEK